MANVTDSADSDKLIHSSSDADADDKTKEHFDESPFESPEFDPIEWVNSSSSSNVTEVNELLDAVQKSFLSCHAEFSAALSESLAAVPQAVRSVEKLRQQSTSLQARVDGVGERVLRVESGVAKSVSTISSADQLVQRVEAAVNLLKQALEAERLLQRLDALMTSTAADASDLVTAADVLQQLRQKLAPLEKVPELGTKFASLASFDRRLETLAAPRLKMALLERNIALASNIRRVFSRAGRESAFATQYVSIRSDEIQSLWSSSFRSSNITGRTRDGVSRSSKPESTDTRLSATAVDPGAESHRRAFEGFNKNLSQMLFKEHKYLQEAFPEISRHLLCSLISCALPSLDPPVLDAENIPAPPAAVLLRFANLQAASESAVTVCAAVIPLILPGALEGNVRSETSEPPESESADPKEQPAETLDGPITVFDAILVTPLLMYRAFARISSALAVEKAKAIPLGNPTSLSDLCLSLKDALDPILGIVDELASVTITYTGGFARKALVQAINVSENFCADRISRLVRSCTKGRKVDEWSTSWDDLQTSLKLLNVVCELVVQWRERIRRIIEACASSEDSQSELKAAISSFKQAQKQKVGRDRVLLKAFCELIQARKTLEASMFWYRTRYSDENQLVQEDGKDAELLEEGGDERSTAGYGALIWLVKQDVHIRMLSGVRSCFKEIKKMDWIKGTREDEYGLRSPSWYMYEISDWLMMVPQQIEPFVPQEKAVAELATPSKKELAFYKTPTFSLLRDGHGFDELEHYSFAGGWIEAIARSAMVLYWNEISSLSRVSANGAMQLATDVEYICNLFLALGVKPLSDFNLIGFLMKEPGKREVFEGLLSNETTREGRAIVRRVAALRGVKLSQ